MLQKLERLIDLGIAYLEAQQGGGVEAAEAEQPAAKPARTRKPKAETETAPPPPPPAAPAAPQQTDKESYDELCKQVIGYIGAPAPGHEARRAFAEKHVADTYRVASLSAVPHGPQRDQLIQWFKAQKSADQAAAPAPSGFGV